MSPEALQVEALRVRLAGQDILSVPRLRLAHGELLGVLGPNGAGKTTLLRACLGMQRGVRGRVSVLGWPLERLGSRGIALLRRRVGYVPQLLPVQGEMPLTVREVVAIGRTGIAGLFRRLGIQDWDIVDEWLERLGLCDLADRGYGEISGGQQRKTLIARAMVQRPELLLLDEPTANLDLGWRERIVQIIQKLYEESADLAVLLVCHELEVLPACCGSVVVLESGRIVAEGPPQQVLSDRRIQALYGQGLAVIHQGGRHAVVPAGVRDA